MVKKNKWSRIFLFRSSLEIKRHVGLSLHHPMKSHFYLLQAACWNAPKWMLRKSSLMAIPKRTLSRLGCPWTSPPPIHPFSSLLSRSSEESPWHFASFILYPGNTNYAQGLSSNLQPDMGWAGQLSPSEGLRIKASMSFSTPSMCHGSERSRMSCVCFR